MAITVNLGIRAACGDSGLRAADVQFLLQVHDSAGFQWPTKIDFVCHPSDTQAYASQDSLSDAAHHPRGDQDLGRKLGSVSQGEGYMVADCRTYLVPCLASSTIGSILT